MSIHADNVEYAVYARESNRHKWFLTHVCHNKASLIRGLYLDQMGFDQFQHGYIMLDSTKEYVLDDLPKTAKVKVIRSRLTDEIMVKALDDFFLHGIIPTNSRIIYEFQELNLLQKDC